MTRRAIALLALAVASCQGPSDSSGRAPLPAATVALAVQGDAGQPGPLALSALKRLAVGVTYQGEPGSHSLRLDLLAPSGQLYTQLSGALDAGPEGDAKASLKVEVAGTPIEAYHMTGAWQVLLSVDGGPPLASATVDVVD